jgi:hypothetical protein
VNSGIFLLSRFQEKVQTRGIPRVSGPATIFPGKGYETKQKEER